MFFYKNTLRLGWYLDGHVLEVVRYDSNGEDGPQAAHLRIDMANDRVARSWGMGAVPEDGKPSPAYVMALGSGAYVDNTGSKIVRDLVFGPDSEFGNRIGLADYMKATQGLHDMADNGAKYIALWAMYPGVAKVVKAGRAYALLCHRAIYRADKAAGEEAAVASLREFAKLLDNGAKKQKACANGLALPEKVQKYLLNRSASVREWLAWQACQPWQGLAGSFEELINSPAFIENADVEVLELFAKLAGPRRYCARSYKFLSEYAEINAGKFGGFKEVLKALLAYDRLCFSMGVEPKDYPPMLDVALRSMERLWEGRRPLIGALDTVLAGIAADARKALAGNDRSGDVDDALRKYEVVFPASVDDMLPEAHAAKSNAYLWGMEAARGNGLPFFIHRRKRANPKAPYVWCLCSGDGDAIIPVYSLGQDAMDGEWETIASLAQWVSSWLAQSYTAAAWPRLDG